MNATPPEANFEYSRAPGDSGRLSGLGNAIPAAVFGGGLLGALLLVVAEFTTLYTVQTTTSQTPIRSVGTGDHHAYALIPIAALTLVLAYGAWRQRSRPALVALGALGVLTLAIALAGDLPDAHTNGLIKADKNLSTGVGQFVNASSRPSTGLYMETLAAAVLMMSCGVGFLLGGVPMTRAESRRSPPPEAA